MSADIDTGEQARVVTPSPRAAVPNQASDRTLQDLVAQAAVRRAAAVAHVVDALTGSDVHGLEVGELLHRVAHVAKATVADCDSAGVTVVQKGTPFTSAWTDERTLSVDQDQYDEDEGPCLHAVRTGTCVRVSVTESRQAWPAFTRAAEADGVKAFLACPLVVDGVQFGALNLYSHDRDGFDDDDEAVATLISRITTGLVSGRLEHHRSATLIGQLEEAIASRAVIEQAKGAIAVVRRISAEEAFEVLKKVSQESNVKLREVAVRTLREFGAQVD